MPFPSTRKAPDAELVLVALQHRLQAGDPHPHAHDADHLSALVVDLAVDEHGDPVFRALHLVVVHVHGVVLGALQQLVIPDVLRIAGVQHPVEAVEIVVAAGARGDQEDRVVVVFPLVGAEVFAQGADVGGVVQRSPSPERYSRSRLSLAIVSDTLTGLVKVVAIW